ncbi:sensor histidine kinase N-terminal domain-containing protein [Ramlibacter sp.]|uniref:sensor histidine kinase n=1 Tax=Ramlibacter sp. TaxID=1917967 RepID=UPI0035B31051
MRWPRLRRLSLARALGLLLVPALLLLAGIEHLLTTQDVHRAANAAYDRSLLGALKAVDASISAESGGLSVELPYRLFEFFELTASGPVHFRVATADGLVELGSADLPRPAQPLQLQVPQIYDGSYFGEPVRVAAYLRELETRSPEAPRRQVVIQVAESYQSRQEFTRVFVRRAAIGNLLFLVLTLATAAAVIAYVLRPLGTLSAELSGRAAAQLQPIATDAVPGDVRPLVEAVNQHMLRVEQLTQHQRQFLDDASHQLRTHLTTLRMQADYAAAEEDAGRVRAAVEALRIELQRAARSTNQLLSLARSDSAALAAERFDALALLQECARSFVASARARGIDLGVEGGPCVAHGDRGLLHEALVNLLANAIAYVPEGGTVTLSCAGDAMGTSMTVLDDGPGVSDQVAAAAGTRFVRGAGSGLGLAIARSVAARHGGVLRLERPDTGTGLRATIWWPDHRPPEETLA